MYPTPFALHQPTSVHECIELLGTEPHALILAGGQHALARLNRGEIHPATVVDLNRIASMASIELASTSVRLGAMVRPPTIEQSPHIRGLCSLLSAACAMGDARTAGQATLGGCLMVADPLAPVLAALIALDARLRVEAAAGGRWIPAHSLIDAPGRTSLGRGALLVGVEVPTGAARHGWAIDSVPDPGGAGALVIVAVDVQLTTDGRFSSTRLAIASVGCLPARAAKVEDLLAGAPVHPDTIAAAGALAANSIAPAAWGDLAHGYRRQMVGVLTRRAIATAIARHPAGGAE